MKKMFSTMLVSTLTCTGLFIAETNIASAHFHPPTCIADSTTLSNPGNSGKILLKVQALSCDSGGAPRLTIAIWAYVKGGIDLSAGEFHFDTPDQRLHLTNKVYTGHCRRGSGSYYAVIGNGYARSRIIAKKQWFACE